jgi:hypothetical protein
MYPKASSDLKGMQHKTTAKMEPSEGDNGAVLKYDMNGQPSRRQYDKATICWRDQQGNNMPERPFKVTTC